MELLIDKRRQLFERLLVAFAPGSQELGNITGPGFPRLPAVLFAPPVATRQLKGSIFDQLGIFFLGDYTFGPAFPLKGVKSGHQVVDRQTRGERPSRRNSVKEMLVM